MWMMTLHPMALMLLSLHLRLSLLTLQLTLMSTLMLELNDDEPMYVIK
jgi:hypothetical protein